MNGVNVVDSVKILEHMHGILDKIALNLRENSKVHRFGRCMIGCALASRPKIKWSNN